MSEIVCQALLTADKVITEELTKKKSLIGVFSNFNAKDVPVVFAPWFIYAAVTNIIGTHKFSINLIHDESSQVLLSQAGEVTSPDHTKIVEFVVQVVGLKFNRFGLYTLQLNFNGKEVISRNIRIQNNAEVNDKKG